MHFRRSHLTRSGTVPCLPLLLAFILMAVGLPAQEDLEPAVEAFFAAARGGKVEAMTAAAGPLQKRPGEAATLVVSGLSERSPQEIVSGLRALKLLGSAGDGGTVIASLLSHTSAEVRAEAVLTAGKVLGAALLPQILAASRDETPKVRRRAFDALLMVDPEDLVVVKAAFEGIFDSDWWVVNQSFRILEQQGDAKVQEQIAKHFVRNVKRLNELTAGRVFAILAQRWPRRAAPALVAGLRSTDRAVVKAALTQVERHRIRDALSELRRIAKDGAPDLAPLAAQCLGTLRDSESLTLLVGLLESAKDRPTREAAAVALRQITGRLYGFDAERWRDYLAEREVAGR